LLTKKSQDENEKTSNKTSRASEAGGRVFQSVKRQREYIGYRTATPELTGSGSSVPILIGAAMIAAAILLSTLITALGSRYVGFENPTEESVWLVDRLTGNVYKCRAPEGGKRPARAISRPAAWPNGRSGEVSGLAGQVPR